MEQKGQGPNEHTERRILVASFAIGLRPELAP